MPLLWLLILLLSLLSLLLPVLVLVLLMLLVLLLLILLLILLLLLLLLPLVLLSPPPSSPRRYFPNPVDPVQVLDGPTAVCIELTITAITAIIAIIVHMAVPVSRRRPKVPTRLMIVLPRWSAPIAAMS